MFMFNKKIKKSEVRGTNGTSRLVKATKKKKLYRSIKRGPLNITLKNRFKDYSKRLKLLIKITKK